MLRACPGRVGRPADQGELVVADVPSSMKRSVRSIPRLRSRTFADFRWGGRRGVFIAQACLKSRAPANYPRQGKASHGAMWRAGRDPSYKRRHSTPSLRKLELINIT